LSRSRIALCVWTVIGTEGTAVVPAFAVPHLDNRIVISRDGSTEEQILGDHTSYTYQLAAAISGWLTRHPRPHRTLVVHLETANAQG
jgi:hypothetical protein